MEKLTPREVYTSTIIIVDADLIENPDKYINHIVNIARTCSDVREHVTILADYCTRYREHANCGIILLDLLYEINILPEYDLLEIVVEEIYSEKDKRILKIDIRPRERGKERSYYYLFKTGEKINMEKIVEETVQDFLREQKEHYSILDSRFIEKFFSELKNKVMEKVS